jgi:hypothetical protein
VALAFVEVTEVSTLEPLLRGSCEVFAPKEDDVRFRVKPNSSVAVEALRERLGEDLTLNFAS